MPAKPMWAKIADDVRAKISSGELAPGDKLPSTAELRRQYGVSAGVVVHAIVVLKAEGSVVGVPGLGTFVAEQGG